MSLLRWLLLVCFIVVGQFGFAAKWCTELGAPLKVHAHFYTGEAYDGMPCRVILFTENKRVSGAVFWHADENYGTFTVKSDPQRPHRLVGLKRFKQKKLVIDLAPDSTKIEAVHFMSEPLHIDIRTGQLRWIRSLP